MKAPRAQENAAFSISASLSTIALALPPNSIKTGFRFLPAVVAMILPTAVLPVKLIFFTAGCSISVVVTSAASCGLQESTLRQPAGRPASSRTEQMAQKQRGDISEPFKMVVLPAARAYTTDRKPRMYGAFLINVMNETRVELD